MTDLLARIPFSDDSDFLAQALAPGLPMLDGRKLAYQVLLGWFGDMLAEPELDDDGVHFYIQSRGQRQQIAEHALATQSDLDGHLAGDYDRLKKALFDVRPVSPSERLIFNRLEPPIVNHQGFLYRVRPSGSSDRLVWCWGFQRRRSTGDVMLCPHADCSLLFVRQETSQETCPRCERALFQQQVTVERRTTFPTGAVAATVMLSGLVGATYWIASVSGDEAVDPLPALAAVTPPELDDPGVFEDEPAATDPEASGASGDSKPDSDEQAVATREADEAASAGDGLAKLQDLPDMPERPEPFANRLEYGNEPLRPFAATSEPRRLDLPGGDGAFEEPQLVDRIPPEESNEPAETSAAPEPPAAPKSSATTKPSVAAEASRPEPRQPALPETALPETARSETAEAQPEPSAAEPVTTDKVASETVTSDKAATDTVADAPEPNPETEKPQPRADKRPAAVDSPSTGSSVAATRPFKDEDAPPSSNSDGSELVTEKPVTDKPGNDDSKETTEPASEWSTEYVAAYQRAIAERRFLVMLFRDPVSSAGDVSIDGLPAAADVPGFDEVVRVVVPTTMPVPGQPSESASRLLDHRSFRHLQGEAGIAIVDLTRTDSPNFGRVVSAFPGATGRDEIIAALQPALSLPDGTISQRSLSLALRTSLLQSAFVGLEHDSRLNDLANRNSRYMAHLDQTGRFETEKRRDAVRRDFGNDAQLRELVFATDSAATIQAAASQAVEHWRSSGELAPDVVQTGVTAYGLELFQSPTTSRWFATLLIVTE